MFNRTKIKLLSIASVSVLAIICIIAAVNGPADKSSDFDIADNYEDVGVYQSRLAGVTAAVSEIEGSAFVKASVEKQDVTEVAYSIEEVKDDPKSEWQDRLMASVDDQMNVRSEASADSQLVGRMRRGDVADIIERLDGWYKINSGNVEGYVAAEYCVVGDEAYDMAMELCTTYATAETGGLRVREEASTDASILTAMGQGDKLVVDTKTETEDGWVAVKYKDDTAYVCEDYVEVETKYSKAITIEEERAAEEAKKKAEEEERKKKEAAKSKQIAADTTHTQTASVAASYDEMTLLAALIQVEAGAESYEGMLAVGSVVMNRVKSPYYPGSISGVIYQGGQFSTGKIPYYAAAGVKPACMNAAIAAAGGTSNIGSCTHFKSVKSGHPGFVIGRQVFY